MNTKAGDKVLHGPTPHCPGELSPTQPPPLSVSITEKCGPVQSREGHQQQAFFVDQGLESSLCRDSQVGLGWDLVGRGAQGMSASHRVLQTRWT